MTEHIFPTLDLDFIAQKIVEGDDLEYIEKINNVFELLMLLQSKQTEGWAIQLAVLDQAKTVPNEIRLALAQFVLDAQIAAQQCASAAAGLNLPPINEQTAGKVLWVKPDQTGYDVVSLAEAVSAAIESAIANLPTPQTYTLVEEI